MAFAVIDAYDKNTMPSLLELGGDGSGLSGRGELERLARSGDPDETPILTLAPVPEQVIPLDAVPHLTPHRSPPIPGR